MIMTHAAVCIAWGGVRVYSIVSSVSSMAMNHFTDGETFYGAFRWRSSDIDVVASSRSVVTEKKGTRGFKCDWKSLVEHPDGYELSWHQPVTWRAGYAFWNRLFGHLVPSHGQSDSWRVEGLRPVPSGRVANTGVPSGAGDDLVPAASAPAADHDRPSAVGRPSKTDLSVPSAAASAALGLAGEVAAVRPAAKPPSPEHAMPPTELPPGYRTPGDQGELDAEAPSKASPSIVGERQPTSIAQDEQSEPSPLEAQSLAEPSVAGVEASSREALLASSQEGTAAETRNGGVKRRASSLGLLCARCGLVPRSWQRMPLPRHPGAHLHR